MKSRIRDEEVALRMDRIWKPVFDKYDNDLDGQIPLNELSQMLSDGNNELRYDIPYEVLQEIAERADLNKDKVITYDEFIAMLHIRDMATDHQLVCRLLAYSTLISVPKRERRTVQHRYLDEYQCLPKPFFTPLLSLLQMGVFLYYAIQYGGLQPSNIAVIDSPFIYDPHRRSQVWRFVTYIFVHVGFLHVFVNLFVQIALGVPLEMVHKWWRVAIVYFAGVLSGSLGAAACDSRSYLAGASGGVYALLTAHAANVILNWNQMEFAWLRVTGLVVLTGADIAAAFYERYHTIGVRVSYAAHLAGALCGLLIGLVVLRNLKVQKWQQVAQLVALALFLFLMVTALVYNIMMTPPFDQHPW